MTIFKEIHNQISIKYRLAIDKYNKTAQFKILFTFAQATL
jgi:hypothetical protein